MLDKLGDTLKTWTPHALIAGGLATGIAFAVNKWLEPVTVTFTTISVRDIELTAAGSKQLAGKLFGSLVGNFGTTPLQGAIMMVIGFAVMVLLGAILYELLGGFLKGIGKTVIHKMALILLLGAVAGTLIMSFSLQAFSWTLLIALALYSLITAFLLVEVVYKFTGMKAPPL